MNEQKFMICSSHTLNSTYPKDKVPIHLFMKNPKDPNSELYKNCLECRQARQLREKKNRDDRKAILGKTIYEKVTSDEKILDTQEIGFKICECMKHKYSKSLYEQDKVPISMFRKEPENTNSKTSTYSNVTSNTTTTYSNVSNNINKI